ANIVPKTMHLHQYGHMAAIYANRILDIEKPRVALLSIGGEEGKGTGLIQETTKLFRADTTVNYVGYAEGRDLFDGRCDVLVTEGFTGNVVLKLAEGLAAGLFKTIAHEIFEQDPELAMKFEPVVKTIYRKHDYHEYGGAPLLGVRGTCLICHGSSEARTIRNAIRTAVRIVQVKLNKSITDRLAQVEADRAAAASPDGVQA
ncbi:MAG: phosphate acyltransferase PlsX, partial [Phycisphaerae bacterium]|nr:phosphate acyltransferase PlsX [Phycisphaerae bacterium]